MKTALEHLDAKANFYGHSNWKQAVYRLNIEALQEIVLEAINDARSEAVEQCAERAEIHYPASNNLNPTVDRKSILAVLEDLK